MAQKYEVGQVAWVLIDNALGENYWDCCRWDGKQWCDFRRYEHSKKSVLEVRLIEKPVVFVGGGIMGGQDPCELLKLNKLSYASFDGGHHLRITHGHVVVDYWPYSKKQTWMQRSNDGKGYTKVRGQGIDDLLEYLMVTCEQDQ